MLNAWQNTWETAKQVLAPRTNQYLTDAQSAEIREGLSTRISDVLPIPKSQNCS